MFCLSAIQKRVCRDCVAHIPRTQTALPSANSSSSLFLIVYATLLYLMMSPDEKARIGYQAALQLISYEGQIIWRSTSALIAANTLLIALSSVAPRLIQSSTIVSVGTPILGMALCLCWLFVSTRQFAYYAYWFAWARHIEQRFLQPEVTIVSTGKTYGEGGTINKSADLPELQRFPSSGRVFPVRTIIKAVIAVFLLIYLALLVVAIRAA